MAKSRKVVSKKVVAPVELPAGATTPANEPVQVPVVVPGVEAPVVPASEPVQAEGVAPTPVSATVPAPDRRARKGRTAEKPVDPKAEARDRWKRRLNRWAKKVEGAGLDPRALMEETLAG